MKTHYSTAEDFKSAFASGIPVFWKNYGYELTLSKGGDFLIKCQSHYAPLSAAYKPEDFFSEIVLDAIPTNPTIPTITP
jgi:hypothetical protein